MHLKKDNPFYDDALRISSVILFVFFVLAAITMVELDKQLILIPIPAIGTLLTWQKNTKIRAIGIGLVVGGILLGLWLHM